MQTEVYSINYAVISIQSELLKAEDVETHICALISGICATFIFVSAKLVKKGTIFFFLTKSDKVLQVIAFLAHFCAKFI